MIDTKFDRKALAEVYAIIIMLDNNDYSKIPKNVVMAIKNNMDDDYEVDIESIERGNLLPDTTNILATLYFYYLANSDEKNIISSLIELKKQQNYIYPIFSSKKIILKETNIQPNLPVVKKENIFVKLWNKIKSIFGR